MIPRLLKQMHDIDSERLRRMVSPALSCRQFQIQVLRELGGFEFVVLWLGIRTCAVPDGAQATVVVVQSPASRACVTNLSRALLLAECIQGRAATRSALHHHTDDGLLQLPWSC